MLAVAAAQSLYSDGESVFDVTKGIKYNLQSAAVTGRVPVQNPTETLGFRYNEDNSKLYYVSTNGIIGIGDKTYQAIGGIQGPFFDNGDLFIHVLGTTNSLIQLDSVDLTVVKSTQLDAFNIFGLRDGVLYYMLGNTISRYNVRTSSALDDITLSKACTGVPILVDGGFICPTYGAADAVKISKFTITQDKATETGQATFSAPTARSIKAAMYIVQPMLDPFDTSRVYYLSYGCTSGGSGGSCGVRHIIAIDVATFATGAAYNLQESTTFDVPQDFVKGTFIVANKVLFYEKYNAADGLDVDATTIGQGIKAYNLLLDDIITAAPSSTAPTTTAPSTIAPTTSVAPSTSVPSTSQPSTTTPSTTVIPSSETILPTTSSTTSSVASTTTKPSLLSTTSRPSTTRVATTQTSTIAPDVRAGGARATLSIMFILTILFFTL
jgi:hypothetical protein